jgi:S1-C subfamily serine protease
MKRLQRIVLTFTVASAVLVAGASAALGLPRDTSSSTRTVRTGVVVVNTRLAFGAAAAGTGIVLTPSGEVLTNNHVIRGATSIRVTDLSAGRTYTATVAGYSISKDIALLRLRNARGLQTALIGESSGLEIGGRVTAVGNAGGTGTLTVKAGRLTGIGRSITIDGEDGSSTRLTNLIQTSAPLRPGDSGGPLLSNGRVIGVDAAATASLRYPDGGGEGFAVPINSALGIVSQVETARPSATVHVGPTAFLGVSLGRSDFEGQTVRGALVDGVAAESPADKAGIGANDLITSFAGRRVTSSTSLRKLVVQLSPGRTVRLTWIDPYTGANTASVRLVSGPPQ